MFPVMYKHSAYENSRFAISLHDKQEVVVSYNVTSKSPRENVGLMVRIPNSMLDVQNPLFGSLLQGQQQHQEKYK